MAGAGIRVFQPGEVLSAATVNTYLMDQAVIRFGTAALRDAAFSNTDLTLPSLSEGRVCYLDSINTLQYYSGSSWVSISAEAVSNTIEAKGDIIVGTAPTTVGRLPVGTNGYFLVADSTTGTGIAWSATAVADDSITAAKLGSATIDEKTTANTTSNNYTLALTDKNKFIKMSITSTANTVTVPTNASVAFPVGSQIHIIQYGSGKTQVIPVSGTVILYATPGAYLRAQYSSATLLKCDTNIWMLMGDLSAS